MQSENKPSIQDKIILATDAIKENCSGDVRNMLVSLINQLINDDFNTLVQILYRIDVDEKRLKKFLQNAGGANASVIIADLIIERQLQKISSKNQFAPKEKPNAEDTW